MEEFRELREQPSDPQAEQELINSIEQVYFSTDSFDIVKYELEVKKFIKTYLKPVLFSDLNLWVKYEWFLGSLYLFLILGPICDNHIVIKWTFSIV